MTQRHVHPYGMPLFAMVKDVRLIAELHTGIGLAGMQGV